MVDKFNLAVQSLESPATGVFTITPSDSADLAIATRAIRASGAGNIVIIGQDGVTATCAFIAGETRAIRATRVNSTNTTATGIEGMY